MIHTGRIYKKPSEKENSLGFQGQQTIHNQHFLSRKLSINKVTSNDFVHPGASSMVNGPRTQRGRKPSGIACINEVSESQDFKIVSDKALKYRSQVCSLNRDNSKNNDSRYKRIESNERS